MDINQCHALILDTDHLWGTPTTLTSHLELRKSRECSEP